MSNINKSMKSGVKWTALNTLINSILQPIYRIGLAFLLTPSDYSYLGIVLLFISFADLLNNVGIGESIIKSENINNDEFTTLFVFNFIVSLFISVTLFSCSNVIMNYYDLNNLNNIIKIVSIIIFFNGITSIFKFYLLRNLKFDILTKLQIMKTIIEITFTFLILIFIKSYVSFLIGVIISNILFVILLTLLSIRLTDIKFSKNISKNYLFKHLSFGINISIHKIINYFSNKIDEVIIGGLFGSNILGTYYFAKNLIFQLQSLLTSTYSQLMLPFFSKFQNEKNKLKNYYLTFFEFIMLIGFPIILGFTAISEIFIETFMDNTWESSVTIFQILSIPTLFMLATAGLTEPILYTLNKTKQILFIDILSLMIYGFLVLFFNDSIIEILIIYAIFIMAKIISLKLLLFKLINIRLVEIKWVIKIIIFSITMFIIVKLFEFSLINKINHIILLAIMIFTGCVIYVLLNYFFNKNQFNKNFNFLKELKNT